MLIALLLRIVWAVAVPVVPLSDSHAYDTFAQNIANGYGYGWTSTSLTAYWPVGTSFVYTLFYRVFGHTYLPIVVFNLLLALLIIGVSMHLAKIWFGHRIALLTGLLLALWPSQIQFTTVLASELLFTALVLVVVMVWFNERNNLWSRAILVGIVLAAASYVRPTALLIPLLLLFFRWVSTREILKTLNAILIVFVLMALLIAPWSIRNTQLYGQFVLISTNGGANLWMGNNPNSKGEYMKIPTTEELAEMNMAQRDKYLGAVAIAYIKEKPLEFVIRTLKKLVYLHDHETIGVHWNKRGLVARYGSEVLLPLKAISQIYWLLVLGLALIGIILLGKQHGWRVMIAHPTVVVWGYFTSVHAVIIVSDRMHFYSIPMIAILAALTLTNRLDWLDTRRRLKRHLVSERKPA